MGFLAEPALKIVLGLLGISLMQGITSQLDHPVAERQNLPGIRGKWGEREWGEEGFGK